MKQPLWAAVILFTSHVCSAQQNMAPNNGFETYSSCPTGGGQADKAIPWFNPNDNSPDYFNVCSTHPGFDMPYNTWGLQYGRDGNAYCGVTTYYGTPDGREYIETPLLDSLEAGRKYNAEIWISLQDMDKWATDKIGACFTANALTSIDLYLLPCNPKLENTTGNVIKDTVNWVLISGEF